MRKLYIQVLIAIALAIAFGLLAPHEAVKMRPLGESFIALLKMMLGPSSSARSCMALGTSRT
ncbi:cation:dicarboxylate symporter family transporter [Paraburkholderia guartelaensis]|uniref:cation:dicarboxylate symporter family transporter n=1 Tax=Paraburkholderia guartelaensis TaxID=2546446 RepID=UPI002AB6A956|nr:cation:dicarboxylase symporter family transporter [Paraburkholderia guartelaensis]